MRRSRRPCRRTCRRYGLPRDWQPGRDRVRTLLRGRRRRVRDRARPPPDRDVPFRYEASTAWAYPPVACAGAVRATGMPCVVGDGACAPPHVEAGGEQRVSKDGARSVRRGRSARPRGGGGEGEQRLRPAKPPPTPKKLLRPQSFWGAFSPALCENLVVKA